MNDRECVDFLQWALPRLEMRWAGFRRVRRQVRRRINARRQELGLSDAAGYRAYLESHESEWTALDALCRVTISRFYRNRGVFELLFDVVLPSLAARAVERGDDALRIWSAGSASGEEAYTIAIGWTQAAGTRELPVELRVVGTDADAHMIERARTARYPAGCLRELPTAWRDAAFDREGDAYVLRPAWRESATFEQQDIRRAIPAGPFDAILCRNLVFTYFAEALQTRLLDQLAGRLVPGGALVLGHHETLPGRASGFEPWDVRRGVWRRVRTVPQQHA